MKGHFSRLLSRQSSDYGLLAEFAALFIATLALVGWICDFTVLKSILPGYVTMKANTALCFIFAGLAQIFSHKLQKRRLILAMVCSLVVSVVCVTTLFEYLTPMHFNIDQVLVLDLEGIRGRFPPGRPAPITAINFLCLAVASFLSSRNNRRLLLASQVLAAITLFTSFQALVGYVIGLSYLFGSSFYTQMAIHTALCFMLLAIAQLLTERKDGIMRSFTAQSPTAKLMRWMILTAIFIPVIVKWIGQSGLKAGLYDEDFAQLIQVVGITGLMIVVIGIIGTALFRWETDYHRQQQVVEANERENLNRLFAQVPEMVCILSGPHHRFEFVNEGHKKVLGFDATGMTVREAQPESIQAFHLLDRVFQTGQTANLHEIPITVGKRLRYFNLTYAARYDITGRIDGIMVLGVEVTEQIERTSGFDLQRDALEHALNGSPLPEVLNLLVQMVEKQVGDELSASILLADDEGQRLVLGAAPHLPASYNQAVQGMQIGPDVGSCGAAAFSRKTTLVADIATDFRWANYKELALQHGLKACWSVPVLSSQGKLLGTFSLYSRQIGLPSPHELQIVEIAARTAALIVERQKEFNERVAGTRALKESEDRLNLALHSGQIGLWNWNAKTGVVYLSETLMNEWGIDRQNFKGTLEECLAVIHPDDRDRVWSEIQRSTFEERPYDVDYRILRKDGEVWINAKGRYFLDGEGQPDRLTGITLNITERRKFAEELKNAKEDAERANTMKSSFLANMSHEIRTPLGAITGFVGLLKGDDLNGQDLSDHIGVIERNANQLLRIIDDILDLSKVEAGKMQIEYIDFSLVEMLADFSSLMGFRARDKGIHFQLNALTLLPSVVTSDSTRIRQILSNVVGNAIKFTEKGEVKMVVSYVDEMLEFRISDTGTGISPDQASQLFQPFHQADISTTRRFGGTGLGLVLTRRLSEALNGSFILESSTVGKGSVFVARIRIGLPAHHKMIRGEILDSAIQPIVETKENSKPLQNMKILIVDDSTDNQVLFKLMLTKAGATTTIASDGMEGMELALAHSYDVMILDIQMPRMDGHETTRALRAKGYDVPIIALTAHAMVEERDRASQSGFTDFLSKPVNRDHLIEMIQRVTKGKARGGN